MSCTPRMKKFKSALTIGTLTFMIIGGITTAWIQLGFPMFASAEDVKILTKGQAQIGIVQSKNIEKQLRKERRQLQWDLGAAKKNEASPAQIQLMEQQIEELEIEKEEYTNRRRQYERQYIEAEK